MRIEAYGQSPINLYPKSAPRPTAAPASEPKAAAANEKTEQPSGLSAQDKLRELLEEKRLSTVNAFDETTPSAVLGAHIDLRV